MLKLLGGQLIKQVSIRNIPYCLIQAGSNYFLTASRCPHMDYPLSDGSVHPSGAIVCMWHAYRFDLSTGNEISNRCKPLVTYPLYMDENGKVMVDLADPKKPHNAH